MTKLRFAVALIAAMTTGACSAPPPGPGRTSSCAQANGGCPAQSSCTDTSGGPVCTCLPGFVSDGAGCTDANECASDNGGCAAEATCTNTVGSRACSCPPGYVGNGLFCDDSDECATDNGGCGAGAACTNLTGSFECACLTGYAKLDGGACADIDECSTGGSNCDALATCTNTPGAFTCTCPSGYAGTGAQCADVNECVSGNGGCGGNALCTNTPGSSTCACVTGYRGDGGTCDEVNECAENSDNCATDSVCANTQGSFSCTCNTGYSGDGGVCTDNNECTNGAANCAASAVCTNLPGSFQCACPAGFSGDGFTCEFCVVAVPNSVAFGAARASCLSPLATVKLVNTCGSFVSLGAVSTTNASFSAVSPPAPQLLLADQSRSYDMRFSSSSAGNYTGDMLVPATFGGQQHTVVVPMTASVTATGLTVETFAQPALPKADVLIVISDAQDMAAAQTGFRNNFLALTQYATAAQVDYRIAIATMDGVGSTLRSYNGVRVLTPATPNVAAAFAAMANVGTSGGGGANCFESAVHVLSDATMTAGVSMLRPGVPLSIICLSTEAENSPLTVQQYQDRLMALKPGLTRNNFVVNGVYGDGPPPTGTGCTAANSPRYTQMITSTNGVRDHICTPNWTVTNQQLGKTAFGFRTDFFLASPADLTNGRTIEVLFDGVSVPAFDSRGATVWSYDSVDQSVSFEPAYVPEPGQTMQIRYFPVCN